MILPLLLAAALAAPPNVASRFARDVRILAADDMEGRGLSTRGIERAAEYIEKRLRGTGLEPAFGTSYRQPFEVKTGVAAGEGNELAGIDAADWTPLGL